MAKPAQAGLVIIYSYTYDMKIMAGMALKKNFNARHFYETVHFEFKNSISGLFGVADLSLCPSTATPKASI